MIIIRLTDAGRLWQPTHTKQPSIHVPKAFGTLRFAADDGDESDSGISQ